MHYSAVVLLAALLSLVFIFLFSGMWLGGALGLTGLIGFLILLPGRGGALSAALFNFLANYSLAAIPLFVFMGGIIVESGLGGRVFSGIDKVTGIIPGGAVQTNIASCAFFAAVSGSSAATAAAIGSIAYPEQMRRGYYPRLIVGSLAAGGTLGILIPPSVTMILYGAYTGESVGKLFIGGVIPGIITSLMFMMYIAVWSLRNPELCPPRQKLSLHYFRECIIGLNELWPILLLIALIMGSIYGGIATPTEVAAIASCVAAILAAALEKLDFNVLKKAALSTVRVLGILGFIVIGATTLAYLAGMLKIPALLSEAVVAAGINRFTAFFLVALMYLVLGCFMDGISLMILTVPITYPVVVGTLGFNGIWFGVIVTMLVECALLTPPVGMNLFMIQSITKQKDLGDVIAGSLPFFIILLCSIILCTFAPGLVTTLPEWSLSF